MFGNLGAADVQPEVIPPQQAGTDDLINRRQQYLQWLANRDTNTSSGINSGTQDLEARNADFRQFLQDRSNQGTFPYGQDPASQQLEQGSPVKKGLRSTLLSMLRGFAYGGAAGALQGAVYPGDVMGEAFQHRQAALEHQKLINQQLAQGMTPVDVVGPDGQTHYQIPQHAVPNFLISGFRIAGQNQRAGLRADTQLDIANQRNASYLASRGFTLDENNQIVPMDRSQMSPLQTSKLDLNDAHMALADAQSELAAARAAGEPQRIAIAARNAQTAQDNYALKLRQFNVATYGTDNGAPVPGGLTDSLGNPIGSASPQARFQVQSDLQEQRDQAAMDRQSARQAATPPRRGYVRIRDSQGGLHDLPAGNLDAAKKRDPGLQVIQ